VRVAFLGCGFITRVHSQNVRTLAGDVACSYASRDAAKASAFCREFGGTTSYSSYRAALDDATVDAVVVAVPPKFHLELTLAALEGNALSRNCWKPSKPAAVGCVSVAKHGEPNRPVV
jgi:predicted dehydrogenase